MKRLLERLTEEKTIGPSPSFSVVHAIKALELIAERPIGRSQLSKELALGGGVVRTLIGRLRASGLIEVGRAGCVLSERGQALWQTLRKSLRGRSVLGRSGLTLAEFNVAVLVKGHGDRVRVGMEQRDAALMVGAKGATTLVFEGGKLTVPPGNRSVAEDFPEINRKILDSLNPQENDVIVIGSADSVQAAEYGALAAAWVLMGRAQD